MASKPDVNAVLEREAISKWLTEIHMQEYLNLFLENGYDCVEVIRDIKDEELAKIGISKAGHRKKILMGLDKLIQIESNYDTLPPGPLPEGFPFFTEDELQLCTNESNKYLFFLEANHLKINTYFIEWFRPSLTRQEAENELKEKEEGSFIIRSGRDPSYYVLTHIKNNHVNHTKISKSEMSLEQLMKQCYDMTSISPDEEIIQPLKEEENVGTLYSIFDEHDIKTQLRRKPTFRKVSISTRAEAQMGDRIAEMDWYFGDISRKEADEILAKSTKHTFLIRESSVPNCYACSVFNFNTKQVNHSLITRTSIGTFKFSESNDEEYPSLIALVLHCKILKKCAPPDPELRQSAFKKSNPRMGTIREHMSPASSHSSRKGNELHDAIKTNDITKLKTLLSGEKCKILINEQDEKKYSPLVYAFALNRVEMIKLLLKAYTPADLNLQDAEGNTLLHYSMTCGAQTKSILPLLRTKELRADIANHKKITPLHLFCQHFTQPAIEVMALLFDRGSQSGCTDIDGETSLHKTARNLKTISGSRMAKQLLTKHGAKINAINAKGETALHIAVECNNEDVLLLLLDFGVDVNIKTKDGLTPIELAQSQKKETYVDFMKNQSHRQKHRVPIQFKSVPLGSVRGIVRSQSIELLVSPSVGSEKERAMKQYILAENEFIQELQLFNRLFIQPLKEENIITPEQVKLLCFNWEDLLKVHENLLALVKKVDGPNAFTGSIPSFSVYKGQIENMAKSLDTFVQLEKVQKFAEFAKGVFSKPEWKSLGFEAFISKPFQRLCQYPSQLQHIHNQYDDPIEASKMDDAISKFQELIKEITSDLGTTQHGLGPSLASNEVDWLLNSKKLIRKGDLKKVTSEGLVPLHLVLIQGYIILFDINKQKKLELGKHGIIPISVIFVQDVQHTEYQNVISLVDVSQRSQVLLVAKDNQDLLLWLHDIQIQCSLSLANLS